MDTLNIKHILVPTDFSPASLNALDTAIALAKRQHAKLTLLHVVNESLLTYGHFDTLPISTPVISIMKDESAELLEKVRRQAQEEHGITIHAETAHGFVASGVCKMAVKLEVDMIVMGTHGASGFREFFIGTNAYAVVKHAPCPVLTVPPGQQWLSFSKILFPVRDTNSALEKYSFLRQIIRHNKAMLLVLGIPDSGKSDAVNWVESKIRQLKTELSDDDVMSRTEILKPSARAASDVLETAKNQEIDLIAITANLDQDIRDFFVGPYTQQIVNHAKVPVLSIRPTPLPGDTQKVVQSMRDDYGPLLPNMSLQYPRLAIHL